MKLTNATVAALALPKGKTDHIEWDDGFPGFGLRLRLLAGGKLGRSYVLQYKQNGVTRRLTLAADAPITVAMARKWAEKNRAKVRLGEDPQADRQAQREKDARTMRSEVTTFLALKQKEQAPRTFVETTRYLTDSRYFGPLHKKALHAITVPDVDDCIAAIQDQRGKPTAARARGALVTFFAWAVKKGRCPANPTINSDNPKLVSRSRVLTGEELVRVWTTCGDDDHGRIIRLLICLGARRQEIGGMAWPEFDLDSPQPTWTLPAERSKNGKAHTLPLMPMAERIIRAVPRLASRDLLFGTSADYGFSAWAKGKAALDQRLGDTVKPWVVHDTRRSVATGMADIGVMPHIIEEILNHTSGHKGGIAGIYNRSSYARETRTALAMWEDHLRSLLDGGERKVIPMSPAAS
jgi:integrase